MRFSASLLLIALWTFPVQAAAQTLSYTETLLQLCHTLLGTQRNDPVQPQFGALVCLSRNPDTAKIHSRAAEAVYPFAIAFKQTGNPLYSDAAIRLGNWLIGVQDTTGFRAGGWSEDWPDPEQRFWYGTTTDQLISLAGAFPILRPYLSAVEAENWKRSMAAAADFIVRFFPIGGNINYSPTAAATLVLTHQVVDDPDPRWLLKADSLIYIHTLPYIDAQQLLTGEGMGVDGGYNIAQSIGYLALYGILTKVEKIREIAADLLRAHLCFIYPNGSVDNSWGTRSFKWLYESGTKTAPGVYFTFALLADLDPQFPAAGQQCLTYLNQTAVKNGWLSYGPHASAHASSDPPCNYSTFARAQSLALAVEYGRKALSGGSFPGSGGNWLRYFPPLNLAVVRTKGLMATVSAYGAIGRYPRANVCRGGSVSNLWVEGFGAQGFFQSSSAGVYQRIEARHMPVEPALLPLTPRIQSCSDSALFSNIFEAEGKLTADRQRDHIRVQTDGYLYTAAGTRGRSAFQITHRFYDHRLVKEYRVGGEAREFEIIEPIVQDPGTRFRLQDTRTVLIQTASGQQWTLTVTGSSVPFQLMLGEGASRYWCPFPGVEAYPVIIRFSTITVAPQRISLTIEKRSKDR